MKILALEFSSPLRSVAVAVGGRPGPSWSEVAETAGRATRALGMIEEALRQAQLEREQIECLVVGLGPGSYNGIRTSIALAQGWQLARPIKLMGLSSAECIAAQAQSEGMTGLMAVVIDAQRGEFYVASYEIDVQSCREVCPLRLAAKSEVEQRQRNGEFIIGPEVTNWFPGSRVVFPRSATLARVATGRSDLVAGEKLEPIYLRETSFVKAPPPRIVPS